MKNKFGIQCIALFIGCLGFVSCSDSSENGNINGGSSELLPVNIRVATADLPEDLSCKMYIFSKSAGESVYMLKDSIHLDNEKRRILSYIAEDWNEDNYRFLFIALPAENGGLRLINNTGSELTRDIDTWDKIRIKADDTKNISGDCYFGVIEKTKDEIDNSRLISAEIKRLVGQMAIDIYRADDGGAAMDKQTAHISNVLDRVYQIDFDYSGLTDEIAFDEEGEPVWKATTALTQTSMNIQLGDTLQMYLEDNPLLSVAAEETEGSVRIRNLFCLPSTDNVKMKVTFHYHDTTPMCGDFEHAHYDEGDACFTKQALVLNLPQNNDEKEYLDILPNYYTVNKAGLPLDRVIDVLQTGSFGFNTVWENESQNN